MHEISIIDRLALGVPVRNSQICLLIRKSLKRIGPQIENPQSSTIAEARKCIKLFYLSPHNFGICDLENLFADRPPLTVAIFYSLWLENMLCS